MIDTIDQCEYFYNTLHIPFYLYDENKNLLSCFPTQDSCTYPLTTYLNELSDINEDVCYIETRFYTYYGFINDKKRNSKIIIGPIHPLAYTEVILSMMHEDFEIPKSKMKDFNNFFYNIPVQSIETFSSTLLLINNIVNQTYLNIDDIRNISALGHHSCINKKYYEESISSLDEQVLTHNFTAEKEFLEYVETGNIEKMKLFFQKNDSSICIARKKEYDYLRRKKNTLIIAISLMARSAINGGLSPYVANRISDGYLQKVEQQNQDKALDALFVQVAYDYTSRISELKLPPEINNMIYEIREYVNKNTYTNITVSDIAEHMNFNRSYLSRKFKKEFGMELSKYIQQTKLEEGKNLLRYSETSIGDISNLLCFSSQSHFQKAFKKQFNITPQQYRNTDAKMCNH